MIISYVFDAAGGGPVFEDKSITITMFLCGKKVVGKGSHCVGHIMSRGWLDEFFLSLTVYYLYGHPGDTQANFHFGTDRDKINMGDELFYNITVDYFSIIATVAKFQAFADNDLGPGEFFHVESFLFPSPKETGKGGDRIKEGWLYKGFRDFLGLY